MAGGRLVDILKVLVAMKEESSRLAVSRGLARCHEREVHQAVSYDGALQAVARVAFDVVVSDVSLPGAPDLELVRELRARGEPAVLLVATSPEETGAAAKAISIGASGTLRKPVSSGELEAQIRKGLEVLRLRLEAQSLRGERDLYYRTDYFVGRSPQIRRVLELVGKVAATDSTVILEGETGTGKELLAGAIHHSSRRSARAFVKVNCAALPDPLLESELFGHERGAFTGAERLRIGRFEQADGGSIFLDEVGDMSLSTQAKVLRVLQEREFERLGGSRTISVDLRIICATNRDLQSMVRERQFREDLYFRLNVVSIRVPPLRQRQGDVELLASFFLRKLAADLKRKVSSIDPEAMAVLARHSWPGNVRELRNALERAVIMAEGDTITPRDIELPGSRGLQEDEVTDSDGGTLEEIEKRAIRRALERSGWVQSRAAKSLGISRRAINYKIRKYGFRHPRWLRNA